MKVTIYDKKPGTGFSQSFLMLCWAVGCWFQKLVGAVDDYFGAESWEHAEEWLKRRGKPISQIQYWGHGSPGCVWLAQKLITVQQWLNIKAVLEPSQDTLIWFRTCSTFQGSKGHAFSKALADGLGCTIGGHTRIIGPLQGGLHTRKPSADPSWPDSEGELPKSWWPSHLRWGPHTIICLATKIPKGW